MWRRVWLVQRKGTKAPRYIGLFFLIFKKLPACGEIRGAYLYGMTSINRVFWRKERE